MNRPTVSIVIRCYNEENHIGRLLTGILDQTLKGVEVVVVDSGSTDATVSIASKYPINLVSIRPDQFSFGYSLNQGCAAARGEFVVIASAHVYPVFQDWLEQLLRPFSHDTVALTYGGQIGNEFTRYSEHQVFAKWFPTQSTPNQPHPFCNNANAAIRRALWQEVAYDETLTGLEDLDWAHRIMALGHAIAYVAEAKVVHVHEETPREIYNRYRREALALKRIYPQEHLTLTDAVTLTARNIAGDLYHALCDRQFLRNLVDIPLFRFMQFLGSYRGFNQSGPVTSELKRTFYYPRSLGRSSSVTDHSRRRIDYSPAERSSE